MENKEYYTVKEIIFGLRNEYCNIESKLQSLRNFCIHDERLVSGYRFDLSTGYGEKANIICRYMKKENLVQKFLRKTHPVNSYIELTNINTILCTKDNNDKYFISKYEDNCGLLKYSVAIREDKNKEFSESVSKLLNSDFVTSINDSVKFDSNGKECVLRTTVDNLDFIINIDSEDYNIVQVHYHAKSDLLTVRIFGDKQDFNKIINYILDIKVPKEKLNSYHLNLVNNSKIYEKNISLEKLNKINFEVNFAIKEENNQIVLSKLR